MTATLSPQTMPIEQLEPIYEALAEGVDQAGAGNESLFLAKLALLLAHHIGDAEVFKRSVTAALADLPRA